MKFSVITICYNAEATLEKTIQSVRAQDYPDMEYIIIDGNSTDATLSIIKKHSPHITHMISEKDKGIFDAMNKGVTLATGDVLYFLNADDQLFDLNVLSRIASQFTDHPDSDIIYGDAVPINHPAKTPAYFMDPFRGDIQTPLDALKKGMCQQRLFIRKNAFNKIGLFNLNYKIAGDIDWFIRAVYHPLILNHLKIPVTYYNCTGESRKRRKELILNKLESALRTAPLQDTFKFLIFSLVKRIRSNTDHSES